MGQTEIIQDSRTILHIINTNEIQQTINAIENNAKILQIDLDPIIKKELEAVRAKLSIIQPKGPPRSKRGLANFIGSAQKWLFGTMDDEDRQTIAEHLRTLEENTDNSIGNLNKQISINSNLNESINHLKDIIESDRNEIIRSQTELTENAKHIITQQMKTDILLRIRIIEEKLNQIVDNIALVKHGLIHPSMLTATEIEDTQLDFYRLKNVKTGLITYDNHTLVLAVKIPNKYKLINYKLITALPTKDQLQVIIEDQLFLEINKTNYEYNNSIQYEKDLKIIKNCIHYKNCKLRENNVMEIKKIDENTVICKNMENVSISNHCDDRKIKLQGHFLININNCTIEILDEKYGNINKKFEERFFYYEDVKYNFTKELDFKDISLKNIVNLDHIKNLKFHKNVQYITDSAIIVTSVIIIVLILTLGRRNRKIKITAENKTFDKIQGNFNLNEGVVTYLGKYPSL